jgi:hypothetical protein
VRQQERERVKYRLHPLIHTFPTRNLAQDVEKKKAEPRNPHFLSLNQDIVAWSQEGKCGLKYVIHSLGGQLGLRLHILKLSNGIVQV